MTTDGVRKTDKNNLFEKILLYLGKSYIEGYSSILVLEEILKMQRDQTDTYISYSYILNYLYGLSYESAVLNISNILIKDRDSINVHYLLSYYENNALPSNQRNEDRKIHNNLIKLRDSIPISSELYLGIKDLRDKYIAHMDRKRLLNNVGSHRYLDVKELKKAYQDIGSVINELLPDNGINLNLLNYEQLDFVVSELRLIIDNLPTRPL